MDIEKFKEKFNPPRVDNKFFRKYRQKRDDAMENINERMTLKSKRIIIYLALAVCVFVIMFSAFRFIKAISNPNRPSLEERINELKMEKLDSTFNIVSE